MSLPMWFQAGLWGLASGFGLVLGAGVGYWAPLTQRTIAAITAFGSGVLIAALSFSLMQEAYHRGGFVSTSIGFILGSLVYSVANWLLSKHGGKHRHRSGDKHVAESKTTGSGLAIAIGSLLDDIPEGIIIGVSMIQSGAVSLVAVIAIFLSDVSEGLSSSVGMKRSGRSKSYIFGIWGGLCIVSGFSAVLGNTIFRGLSDSVISATIAVAAGALLTMVVDTMVPEAFEEAHNLSGLVAVLGFLASFILSKLA